MAVAELICADPGAILDQRVGERCHAGPLQNVDDVVHVRVRELTPLAPREPLPASHDYR